MPCSPPAQLNSRARGINDGRAGSPPRTFSYPVVPRGAWGLNRRGSPGARRSLGWRHTIICLGLAVDLDRDGRMLVVALLVAVVWNVVAAASVQRAAAPTGRERSTGPAYQVQQPGVNVNTGFLRVALDPARPRPGVLQRAARMAHRAQRHRRRAVFLETVVLPSRSRAPSARGLRWLGEIPGHI